LKGLGQTGKSRGCQTRLTTLHSTSVGCCIGIYLQNKSTKSNRYNTEKHGYVIFNLASLSGLPKKRNPRNPRNPLTYYEIHLYIAKTN